MRRSWAAHLSRGAKGGAFEVDGIDEHLPSFSSVPVQSKIPAWPETDTLLALRYEGFTLSLEGLSLSI
jgi:hypothetical protein